MKIVVAIKQVPARDSQLRIAPSGKWIEEADLSYEINEPDAYALEAGLQLKEKHGGEVIALCAGPARAAQTIREALAKGADRAIHIEEDPGDYDPLAACAACWPRRSSPSRPTWCSPDCSPTTWATGRPASFWPSCSDCRMPPSSWKWRRQDGAIRVKRELEDGWFQHVEMPLPALLTIQSGISKLRYATLMGIKKAKTKEIKRLTAADLGVAAAASSIRLERIYLPERTKRTQLFDGSPKEAAAQLVEKLKFEARVI